MSIWIWDFIYCVLHNKKFIRIYTCERNILLVYSNALNWNKKTFIYVKHVVRILRRSKKKEKFPNWKTILLHEGNMSYRIKYNQTEKFMDPWSNNIFYVLYVMEISFSCFSRRSFWCHRNFALQLNYGICLVSEEFSIG